MYLSMIIGADFRFSISCRLGAVVMLSAVLCVVGGAWLTGVLEIFPRIGRDPSIASDTTPSYR